MATGNSTDRPDAQPAAEQGSLGYVLLLTGVAALGGLLFGYDTAVIAGAIDYLTEHFGLDQWQKGFAVSNVLIGCMFGAAMAGTLGDRFGRRRGLQLSAVLFLVSAVGCVFPRSLAELVAARFVGGLGVGMASLLSPLYIAEVAPARIRGRLVSLNQITIISGMVVVSVVNWWIAAGADERWNVATGWRWMFGSEIAPAALFLALLLLVPESPRWLTQRGRADEAFAVLARVGGRAEAAAQMIEIRRAIAEEAGRFSDLFRGGVRKALGIAVALAVLQQVTGVNAILYYAPSIFKKSGAEVDPVDALLQTVALQVVNLLMTLVSIWLVDRLGRKPLLMAASAAMGVSLALLGLAFQRQWTPGWIFALSLAYIGAFAVAMGPVVWVVLSEIFPTRTRGRAMAVATVALWIACFAVSQTVPWMMDDRHWGEPATFWTYAVMCVVALVLVAWAVPETKGKTLEQIEREWFGGA